MYIIKSYPICCSPFGGVALISGLWPPDSPMLLLLLLLLLLVETGLLFSPEVGVADDTPPCEALEAGGSPGGG